MNVVFLPAAQDEHLAHVDYYECCQPGLGARYLSEMSAAIARIVETPSRFPVVAEPGLRRLVLQQFPFSIIFRSQDESIVIVAVAAHRRAPDYWIRREHRART